MFNSEIDPKHLLMARKEGYVVYFPYIDESLIENNSDKENMEKLKKDARDWLNAHPFWRNSRPEAVIKLNGGQIDTYTPMKVPDLY